MPISKVTTGSISDSVAIDTDTLVVDGVNNRVGIGDNNPTQALSVGGHIKVDAGSTGYIQGPSGEMLVGEDGSGFYLGTGFGVNPSVPYYIGHPNVSSYNFRMGGTGGGNNVLAIDSSGRVTMPYQPIFSGNRAGYIYVNNINASVPFYPLVNQGNHWNTSTHTYTCPVAGKYWVSVFNLNYTGVNSGASRIQIQKNGGTFFEAYQDSPSGTNYHNSSASGVLDCAANDTITFFSPSGVVYDYQYCGATVYLIG